MSVVQAASSSSELRVRAKHTTKRSMLDIMTDILSVLDSPSGKSEIMACANLSYEQCRKYLPALQKLGLVNEKTLEGARKYVMTDRGKHYRLSMIASYGTIASGDRSVWTRSK